MSGAALALVVAAALIHAGWNLWIKHAGTSGGISFVWGTAAVASCVLAPFAFAGWDAGTASGAAASRLGPAAWSAQVWLAVAISAAVHTLYFRALQLGYAHGDLSVVYPVARGTGPLVAALAAIAWLGEPATVATYAGLCCVVMGTFVVAGGSRTSDGTREAAALASKAARRSVGWGLAIGLMIATYTVNDGRAVAHLGADPVSYYWAICVAQAVLMLPWLMRRAPHWRAELRRDWKLVAGVGLLSPASYLLALEAMRLAPLSVVAPARELSMLVAALAGSLLLGEGNLRRRLAGAALIAFGVTLLASTR